MKTLGIGKSKWSDHSHRQAWLGTGFLAICLLSSLPAGAAGRQDDDIAGISQHTEPTQLAPKPAPAPATTTTLGTNSPEQARLLKAWRISMAKIPLPKKGCFEASYPSNEWREVPAKVPQYSDAATAPRAKPRHRGRQLQR